MSSFVRRLRRLAAAFVLACAAFSSPAWAGSYGIGPAPSWVTALEVPAPRAERLRQASNGTYFLLVDHQQRPTATENADFRRTAYQITDRTGLESGARLDLAFDVTEELVLHHVQLRRHGQVEDRLKRSQRRVLQREEDLEEGIFTGRKTLSIEIPDVQVGDVIDYAYTLIDKDATRRGHLYGSQPFGWSVPVALTRYRLLWPKDAPFTLKTNAQAPKPEVAASGNERVYTWVLRDPEPIQEEARTPSWMEGQYWPSVEVSNFRGWKEVVRWAAPMYAGGPLPPAWERKAAEIATRHPAAADRITAALRLVQDEIRYVSLSVGEGSYRPRPPVEVIQSRYGDCKDKSVLLAVLLRRLGVDATPALTDTRSGRALPSVAPSANAFDHAVVRVRLNGQTYWLDPTRSNQGGRFPDLTPVDYGWGLPLEANPSGLEPMARPKPGPVTVDIEERYTLAGGPQPSLRLEVTSIYTGRDADRVRRDFAEHSPAETEARYLRYYAESYPGLQSSAPLKLSDDREANRVVVRESYLLAASSMTDALSQAFPIAAPAEGYKSPPGGARRTALETPWPVAVRHRIVLVTPGRRPPAPPESVIEGDAFEHRLTSERRGDVLELQFVLSSKNDVLQPAQVEAFRTDIAALEDATYWRLDLTSNEGGEIGDLGTAAILFLIAAGLVALGALVWGLRWGLAADSHYAAAGLFYPVSTRKFVVMNLATLGYYSFFWRWKCWRWAKQFDGRPVAPFWRSVFAVIWFVPLFDAANERLGPRKASRTTVAVAMAAYLALIVVGVAFDRLPGAHAAFGLVSSLAFVCYLPALRAVQRLNAGENQICARNSRYTPHSWVAITAGALLWLLALVGLVWGE